MLSAGHAGHLLAPGLAPRKRLLSGLTAFGTGWNDVTCEDFRVGPGWRVPANSLQCKKSKIIFQDHNMPVSCGNVELRGFEPLTPCMPCLAASSGGVLLGRSHDQGGVLACNGQHTCGFAFVLSGGPPPVRWWRGAVQ
jgi:hypothetical protein